MWIGSAYADPRMYHVRSQTAAGGMAGVDIGTSSTPWAFSNWPNTSTTVDSIPPSIKALIHLPKTNLPTPTLQNPPHLIPTPQSPNPSTLNDLALHRAYKTVGMRPSDLRCFNCLEEKELEHRRKWMACSDECPACPFDKQHYGSFCPKLCMLRKKEGFWKERAYVEFKGGYNEPTSGVEGWVREGVLERVGGEEGRAGGGKGRKGSAIPPLARIGDASSIALLSTPTPSTPPFSRSSLATSLTSTEGPKTPELPSKSYVEFMERGRVAEGPRKNRSDPLIADSSSAASQVGHTQSRGYHQSSEPRVTALSSKTTGSHQWVDPSRLSFRQSYRQSRSRSSSPELNTTRMYRDRCDILPAVEERRSPSRPRNHPSIALTFSDPDFVGVIKSETVKILSCSVPPNATRQRQPFDQISMVVLQAAQAVLRNGVETRGYQPSPLMKRYLKDLNRDFPVLMSKHNTYRETQDSARGETSGGTDTYFGHAHAVSALRGEKRNNVAELIELNQQLIKGTPGSGRRAWDQRDHKLEQDGRGYQANTLMRACEPRRQGASKRPVPKDTRNPHWDHSPNKSVTLNYDDAPVACTTMYTPRRPHQRHQDSERRPPPRPTQRRYVQQSYHRTEICRSKQGIVASQARSQAVIPVRRQEPSEEGEVDENDEPTMTSDTRNIFSALEEELEDESRGGGFRIAEECWEDLLRGDV